VLDFGVSKSLLEAQKSHQALTQTANLVGSPLYMSPEQLESSRDVDARADIWGLGIVLYELISGQPPFAAHSIPQLIAAVINERPRRLPPELQVPDELEAVIVRTLAKDRRDRPASIDELMDMLEPFAAAPATGFRTTQLGASDRPRSNSGTPTGLRSTTRTSQTPLSWDRNDKTTGSRKRVAIGAVLVALVAVAAMLAYAYRNGDGPGVAKPLPPHADEAVLGTSAAAVGEREPADKDKEIPRGVLPDAPPEVAPVPQPQPNAAPQALAPTAEPAPAAPAATTAAPKPAVKPQAPALTPVPAAKPAAAPGVHGAPPRGQISDFGGRR
jgi:serine/threonine-protein kinase